ncbi:MAG: hypothetical protein JNN22_00450 [Rhodospirillales bacterium]|nr:hypothetical protein [Rhodospirillales bacterium]
MTPSSSADSVRSYAVVADPDVGLSSRVLEQFAKRDLLPERFLARVEAGLLHVEADCAGMDDVVAEHVRDVLASLVNVRRAALVTRPRRLAA